MTKPEQSAPSVRLDPPYTYGLPTNCVAKFARSIPFWPLGATTLFCESSESLLSDDVSSDVSDD